VSQTQCSNLRCLLETDKNATRIIATTVSTVDKRLSTESTALKKDITDLEKKLHYLETTFKNSREHINRILQTGGTG
jgi:hypothetical protein